MKYGKRRLCGNLKRSLETTVELTLEQFQEYMKYGEYEYRGYDKRVNQFIFINSWCDYGCVFITDEIVMKGSK